MLNIATGRPSAIAVPLGGGAVWRLRPASAFEAHRAGAAAGIMLAGLIESEDAAALAIAALGEQYEGADFQQAEWKSAAARDLALIELAVICSEGWDGVAIGKQPIEPTRQNIALLLRDVHVNDKVYKALNAGIHEEIAEGNA
jgi:hypothetical protein